MSEMSFSPAVAERLAELYGRLRRHFGHVAAWWPGTPFEISITAVLVQQCQWSPVWAAMQRLNARGYGSVRSMASAAPEDVSRVIHPVAFAPTKSRRLVAFCGELTDRGHDDIESFLDPRRRTTVVRENLLSFTGIGPETADCMLLYASTHRTFVVDAITRRVFERLNILPGVPTNFWRQPYESLRRFLLTHVVGGLDHYEAYPFSSELPREVALLRDFHALLVELGKHHCLRTKPRCARVGQAGWKDYAYCEAHCRSDECQSCPCAKACAHGVNVGERESSL